MERRRLIPREPPFSSPSAFESPSEHKCSSRTWNNHVKLSGLKSGTVYFYRVSYTNCAYCAYRPTYSFKTALAAGDHTPFAMATIAECESILFRCILTSTLTSCLLHSLGLMGHDGLSTKTGPLATVNRALYSNETNTIQSLNALKDTYELIGAPACPRRSPSPALTRLSKQATTETSDTPTTFWSVIPLLLRASGGILILSAVCCLASQKEVRNQRSKVCRSASIN